MKKSLLSNQEIIVAIAYGNTAAFKILFDQYYPVLVKVLLRYSSDESQINAWIQAIYLNLWESRANLVGISVEDFKAYFILTARNYAIGESKKGKSNGAAFAGHIYRAADSPVKGATDSLALMGYYCSAVTKSPDSDVLNQGLAQVYSRIETRFSLFPKIIEARISDIISLLRQELVLFRR